jgi:hypothetical protein
MWPFSKKNQPSEAKPPVVKSALKRANRWLVAVMIKTLLVITLTLFVTDYSIRQYTYWYLVVRGEKVVVISVDQTDLVIKKANGWVRSFSVQLAPPNLIAGDELMMGRDGKFACLYNPPPAVQPELASASSGSLIKITPTPIAQKLADDVTKKARMRSGKLVPDSVSFEQR